MQDIHVVRTYSAVDFVDHTVVFHGWTMKCVQTVWCPSSCVFTALLPMPSVADAWLGWSVASVTSVCLCVCLCVHCQKRRRAINTKLGTHKLYGRHWLWDQNVKVTRLWSVLKAWVCTSIWLLRFLVKQILHCCLSISWKSWVIFNRDFDWVGDF